MSEPVLLPALIERLRGRIDEDIWIDMEHYYHHGEWGLAIETLCDGLYEAEESLPVDEVDAVRTIGNDMGIRRNSFLLLTGQSG